MATEKQIEANRANAQKCTGPTTPEGKTASSQNALKTGLHAKSDVIATENRDDYDTLIAEYYARFRPATPEERCLVDSLIQYEWLGRRFMAASAAAWDYDFRILKEENLGRTFFHRDVSFTRAQRIITANQRNYAQTLKQLLALQASQPANYPIPPDSATETEPLTQKLVSFLREDPTPLETAVPHPDLDGQPPLAA